MTGRVVWITGLSGAGKSTVSEALVERLLQANPKTLFLDGDALREVLAVTAVDGADHGRSQRLDLAMRYARLCRLLASQGFTVVIATISLFREVHAWNRANLPVMSRSISRFPSTNCAGGTPRACIAVILPAKPSM